MSLQLLQVTVTIAGNCYIYAISPCLMGMHGLYRSLEHFVLFTASTNPRCRTDLYGCVKEILNYINY